jgi:hypothetical protein
MIEISRPSGFGAKLHVLLGAWPVADGRVQFAPR